MADELDVLLDKVDDAALRAELRAAVDKVRAKRTFGLVFESHLPERVTLPNHPVRRGSTVVRRDDQRSASMLVESVKRGVATVLGADGTRQTVDAADLVVVAEFGQPIYPGLERLGGVYRGGDKPAHVVINAENHHALEMLQFTHAGKVDCIYIDPPYNTGAKDWKYDNNYVDSEDAYRHSKWLAFMERRLLLAKQLLNPDDSVLIVTIDEKEYLRLGLLLQQTFPSCKVQMVSININPAGGARSGAFGRSDEYAYFVMVGEAAPERVRLPREWVSSKGRTHTGNVRWDLLRRSGHNNAARSDRPGLFYPIYVDPSVPCIVTVGEALPPGVHEAAEIEGLFAVLPIRQDGSEGNWQAQPATLRQRIAEGRVRVTGNAERGFTFTTLKNGEYQKIIAGEFPVLGRRADGSLILEDVDTDFVRTVPSTQWRVSGHDATQYGTRMLNELLAGRKFPFPKSLYAVEDALRFFVSEKPDAVVVDFFAGSGTTAHAVMRLNRQDSGRRQAILVTNNEVSPDEARSLADQGYRDGDPEWEALGIFEHITRPRIIAAVTGLTPGGEPVKGDYKFADEFPMAEGFEENVEFVKLTYLDAVDVELDRAFASVAPLLWMRAGSMGSIIESRLDEGGDALPFAVAESYGVLFDPDQWRAFVDELPATARMVFVVTDSPAVFAGVVENLPTGLEAVRLYENYLSTFTINQGRVS